MAFIRKRLSSNYWYGETYSHQLIETYREGGKVKQGVMFNLGRSETVEPALELAQEHTGISANLSQWTADRQR
jgi:hypothetical protein